VISPMGKAKKEEVKQEELVKEEAMVEGQG